jgi:protein KRI1
VTLRQVALEAQLNPSRSPSPEPLTHVQEQQALRKETISAFNTVTQEGEGDDDFLVPREKTKDDQEHEEEEYRAFLEREVGDLKNIIGGDNISLKVEGELENNDDGDVQRKKKKRKKSVKDQPDETEKIKRTRGSKEEEDHEFLMKYVFFAVPDELDSRPYSLL